MRKLIFLLLCQIQQLICRQIFITQNRSACADDQSNCDGTRSKPFSNAIKALKIGVNFEKITSNGTLEFLFEPGIHLILPSDFKEESNPTISFKSPFDSYNGNKFYAYSTLFKNYLKKNLFEKKKKKR